MPDPHKRDWYKTRATIGKVHNVHVKRALKNSNKNSDRKSKQNSKLLEACLIGDTDTIQIALFKSLFFWLDLGYINDRVDAIATVPDHWPRRVGADRPQLVIAYRPSGKKSTYTIVVPHYRGGRSPQIPSYHKGNYRGNLTLTDGSMLTVNAASEIEAARVIRVLRRYIEPKYQHGCEPTFTKVKGKGFKETRVLPVKADFYQHGQTEENRPDWRKYFSRL